MFSAIIVVCSIGSPVEPANCTTWASKLFFPTEATCVEDIKTNGSMAANMRGREVVNAYCLKTGQGPNT